MAKVGARKENVAPCTMGSLGNVRSAIRPTKENVRTHRLISRAKSFVRLTLTLSLPSSKSAFSQPFKEKCISEVVRIW